MNIELIKKLIALANNNPNENEANLSARKVCQLLKDYNFKGGSQVFNDIFGGLNDTPWNHPPQGPPIKDDLDELLKKMNEERKKRDKVTQEQYNRQNQYYANQTNYNQPPLICPKCTKPTWLLWNMSDGSVGCHDCVMKV